MFVSGLYNAGIDYFTKVAFGAYDFQYNVGGELNVDWNNTDYSTFALGNRVVDVINQHDQEKVCYFNVI